MRDHKRLFHVTARRNQVALLGLGLIQALLISRMIGFNFFLYVIPLCVWILWHFIVYVLYFVYDIIENI